MISKADDFATYDKYNNDRTTWFWDTVVEMYWFPIESWYGSYNFSTALLMW